jgi:hypothetical protein
MDNVTGDRPDEVVIRTCTIGGHLMGGAGAVKKVRRRHNTYYDVIGEEKALRKVRKEIHFNKRLNR